MSIRVAINGFGRIGRCVARILLAKANDIELVAINDLTDAATLGLLLQVDSVHGRFAQPVSAEPGALRVGEKNITVCEERDPANLPWKKLGVDVVLECTGLFTSKAAAGKHLQAGAQRVVISAPADKDVDGTFCIGVNSDQFDPKKHFVVSNASCTTNCLAPIAKVLNDSFQIVKGHMVTVHSYTNDQRILDLPHKDPRRARAAALSMIPTSTGAAKAIGLVLPELQGKLDGVAIRVPTPDVSIVCLTAQVAKTTSKQEVNDAMRAAAKGALKGVLAVEDRPLVSIDYIGNPYSSTVDSALTQVVGGDLVEVQSWYDNEWGFSSRMVDMIRVVSGR